MSVAVSLASSVKARPGGRRRVARPSDIPASPPDRGPVIALEGVARVYGSGENEVRALSDIDLQVAEGEFVVVLGPSGSGKTTLLNVIGALDSPTNGRIVVVGVDLGTVISLAPATIATAGVLGIAAVGLAPLLGIRRLRHLDIPSTLRVTE